MRKVISASRRTDLVAFFPEWLSSVIEEEKAVVHGPAGHTYSVDLSPKSVHTFVLWSKNFANLIEDRFRLQTLLQKYDQCYLHFTITGLGGTFIEKGVPAPSTALSQLESLVKLAANPERISVRFDPVIYWRENGKLRTNLHFFEKLAPQLTAEGVHDVRFSFAQWYGKAVKRSEKHGFLYVDPCVEKKKEAALLLSQVAQSSNLRLFACSQNFLSGVGGIKPSLCIDGAKLGELHPAKEPVSTKKDRSQRAECGCTESVDIGSYTQFCPHSCFYCYANPRI
jgi:hypothetical protein